jgi:large subunit ribosomal protein L22
MQGKCDSRYLRHAPRKVAQVLKIIRGRTVSDAMQILGNTGKSCSDAIRKALASALANANGAKSPERFRVAQCYVNRGPFMKRMMPRARGSAAMFTRKTSHITVVVSDEHHTA